MRSILVAYVPSALLVVAIGLLGVMGFGVVRITGDSMRPAIRVGDVAVYRRGQAVGVGDVIVYGESASSRVVHRITHVDAQEGIRTQGDANTSADREPLLASGLEGRVIFTVPTGWMSRVDLPRRGATLLTQIERWL